MNREVWLLLAAATVCAVVGLLCWWLGRRRLRRQVREVTRIIDRVARGADPSVLAAYREGDIHILAGQVELLARRTAGMVERLAAEQGALRNTIADMAHQLKTPLTALTAYLEVLEAGESDPDKRRQLENCLSLIGRMTGLIQVLLDIARLEAGAVKLDIGEHSLDETIGAAGEAVRTVAPDAAVTLSVPAGMTAWYDGRWFSQALVNVAVNAATHGGTAVSLSAVTHESMAVVTVRDNGPGVPAEELTHIFERFYQVKNGRRSGGLGLGLAMADSILRLHHGYIRVENTGEGMAFHLSLPMLNCVVKTEPGRTE